MSRALDDAAWPEERLGEAVSALGERSGLFDGHARRSTELPAPPPAAAEDGLERWVNATAAWLGFEVEAVEASYGEVGDFVAAAGPALLRLDGGNAPRYLALLDARGGRARLLGPDRSIRVAPSETVCASLRRRTEEPHAPRVDRILDEARVLPRRRPRARAALLREQLSAHRIAAGWILRLPGGASVARQASRARLPGRFAILAGAFALQNVLALLGWWMVGKGALSGHFDRGWLLAWMLLLLTQVPLLLAAEWLGGVLALDVARLLKRRTMVGALQLEPEEIRHQGAGQLLGRVIESEAIESVAIGGGFSGVLAILGLVFAASVLAAGAGGGAHVLLLLAWLAATAIGAWIYHRRRARWTDARRDLTNDLVERMAGHRTRLAQESPERWHDGEDQVVEAYLERSRAMDRTAAVLGGVMSGGWLLVGMAGLVPAFVAGAPAASLAVGVGGVLLARAAFAQLVSTFMQLSGAAIAWSQVRPFFLAAERGESTAPPTIAIAATRPLAAGDRLLDGSDLTFRYRERGEPVLRGVSLEVRVGDRILLEGRSGGGKSTLAALLAGLRVPASGLLLVDGLDRRTLGAAGWRRRVSAAPQFHENHVIAGTFAFNLLLGRRWPPSEADLREAETVCRELGLGPLLERMPSGLGQQVGETGWQLSHGEKSRLYIARTLLSGADLLILDESFAALDPETLGVALDCVLRRARTVLVVAHP